MAVKLFDGSTSSKITRMDDGCMDVLGFFSGILPKKRSWEKKKNGFVGKLPNLKFNSRNTQLQDNGKSFW